MSTNLANSPIRISAREYRLAEIGKPKAQAHIIGMLDTQYQALVS